MNAERKREREKIKGVNESNYHARGEILFLHYLTWYSGTICKATLLILGCRAALCLARGEEYMYTYMRARHVGKKKKNCALGPCHTRDRE